MAFRSILVPVDYSTASRRALELALTLDAEAKVTVIHAWDKPPYVGDGVITHADGSRRSLSELIRENAEREMTEFLAQVAVPPGKSYEHHLVSGDPVVAILAEANKASFDVLVVGTNGRTGMSKLLLGSVTEKLIRLSPIPVLTVPPAR
ncbi:MAG TPA: universal stress protein [Polyangiaceae bacterium]|nr:universal stress protein [Polyangiaceae bacterium]